MTFLKKEPIMNFYFIRSKKDKNLFLHPHKETKKTIEYILRIGTVGAAIWKKKAAKNFIKTGNEPLVMVKVKDVLEIEDRPPSKTFEVSKYDLIGWKTETLNALKKSVEDSLFREVITKVDIDSLTKVNDLLIEVLYVKSQIPKGIDEGNLF